ncbi:immunity protein Tsi6 family protein [Pseudomonas sp. zfem003]|uniref:immunity protein Tsi6 family protein n=1 Tax=Pseudomonas sp. zfem003 TaxID=3078198 RepID=UPI002929C449|nr:immunity protein Tsi6 family protein [Pseudomonas sp. zfem003]MDU9396961.1 immunity protein Tsi6 family protein [Pseudomonas sp. zfem003]
MSVLEPLDHALVLVRERKQRLPGFAPYAQAEAELVYLRRAVQDPTLDRTPLHQGSLGALAVKEFEETDPELARALKDAHWIAAQLARGVRVQWP